MHLSLRDRVDARVVVATQVAVGHLGRPLRADLDDLILPAVGERVCLPVVEKHVDLLVNLRRVQLSQLAVPVEARLDS